MVDVALKYWTDVPNAGDLFSRDIAEKYIGPVVARATGDPFGSLNLMLIGSLMLWCDRDTVVCGSGMISPEIKPREIPRKIIAVRGPRSRSELLKLGAVVPDNYGDPGLLAADFANLAVKPTHEYGVILHHCDQRWNRNFGRGWFRQRDDTLYIDIRKSALAVFDEILRCRIVISSSLHGLIFAHALGRRAVWVTCSNQLVGGTFKFYDYFDSVGVDAHTIQPIQISGTADFSALRAKAHEVDVSSVLPKVRANLEETRAYMLTATSLQEHIHCSTLQRD